MCTASAQKHSAKPHDPLHVPGTTSRAPQRARAQTRRAWRGPAVAEFPATERRAGAQAELRTAGIVVATACPPARIGQSADATTLGHAPARWDPSPWGGCPFPSPAGPSVEVRTRSPTR